MPVLKEDTLYYRFDQRDGMLFSAGGDAPDEADGWGLNPDKIAPGPEVTYECTSPEAWTELLRTERLSAAGAARDMAHALLAARGALADARDEISDLKVQIAALTSAAKE